MIQDIYPHHFFLDYKPCSPSADDTVLLFQDGQVLLISGQDYPTLHDLELSDIKNTHPGDCCSDFWFLFTIDEQKFFLALNPSHLNIPLADTSGTDAGIIRLSSAKNSPLIFYPIRSLRTLRPMHLAFAGYTAWHLYSWFQNNRFCGKCGAPTVPGSDERKLVCSNCHTPIYPRINPCIIVAVHDGDQLLMTRYANRPVTWFVLIAGFIEIGETAEDTVRREVMEETGVRVKNIRYFGSQPWGIPGNLTLGFTAELDGSDEITLDTNELSEGRWFHRDEVPVPDDDVSITSELIHAFVNRKF